MSTAGGIGREASSWSLTLDHWQCWRERCALGLCPPEAQHALRQFARARFERWLAAYAPGAGVFRDAAPPPAAEAWHWFESGLCLRRTRAGKSYKEWLFARAAIEGAPTLDAVQGGAALLMRDVVRERLRQDYHPARVLSFDAPGGAAAPDDTPGLHELLPAPHDTRSEVERRELDGRAAEAAARLLAALPRREKVALLAKELGLSLAHPAAIAVADCGKSMLCAAYRAALERIADWVRSRHATEEPSTQLELSVRTFEQVRARIPGWGKSESACAPLFMIAGGRAAGAEGEGYASRPPRATAADLGAMA
jgi:hypothetical protein